MCVAIYEVLTMVPRGVNDGSAIDLRVVGDKTHGLS